MSIKDVRVWVTSFDDLRYAIDEFEKAYVEMETESEDRIKVLEKENDELESDNENLTDVVAELRKSNDELQNKNDELEDENRLLKRELYSDELNEEN